MNTTPALPATGQHVTALYLGNEVSGTVIGTRWHTMRHDLYEVRLQLDAPTAITIGGEAAGVRERLLLSLSPSGGPLDGWNECQLLSIG